MQARCSRRRGRCTAACSSDKKAELLEAANRRQWDLLTNDGSLASAAVEPDARRFTRCVVYLQLEGGDVEQDDAIDRLFERYKRLSPGRLYTVTATRVKVRQLPGGA